MGSRRPKQLTFSSVLAIMPESLEDRFSKFKLNQFKQDTNGNVVSVTTVGDKCPAYPEAEDSDPWWDQAAPEENA